MGTTGKEETGAKPSFSFERRNHYRHLCNGQLKTNQCQTHNCCPKATCGAMEHLEKRKRNQVNKPVNGQYEQKRQTTPSRRNP